MGLAARKRVFVHAYVCVHDYDAYLEANVRVIKAGLCHGIKVDATGVRDHHRDLFIVEARSADHLRCWINDLNAECEPECIHELESLDEGDCLLITTGERRER